MLYVSSTPHQVSSNIRGCQYVHALIKLPPNTKIESGQNILETCQKLHREEFKGEIVYVTMDDRKWFKSTKSRNAKIGVIITSDRASKGIYEDKCVPAVQKWLHDVCVTQHEMIPFIIPDDPIMIQATLTLCIFLGCSFICMSGGTGPTQRDNTAIETQKFLHKVLPGYGEMLRHSGLKYVPTSILSAQVAGIYYTDENIGTFVLNLPGSPNSIEECLNECKNTLPWVIELSSGDYMETNPPSFRGKQRRCIL